MSFSNVTVSEDITTGCGEREKGRRKQTSVQWETRDRKDAVNQNESGCLVDNMRPASPRVRSHGKKNGQQRHRGAVEL